MVINVYVADDDDDEKWHCFICNPEPLSGLVQTCSQFIAYYRKWSSQGPRNAKRRKSANSMTDSPQKRPKSAAIITIAPQLQTQDQRKLAPTKGRLGVSPMTKVSSLDQQIIGSPRSIVDGGLVSIHRPEYDKDMIPVDEHNVWPVLEKLLAATQSMNMLLGSLKEDLQRSSAMLAKMIDNAASSDNHTSDLTLKRREAALKLWRAFDAYQKSFVDIETYSQETNKTVKGSKVVDSDGGSNCVSSASVSDGDETSTVGGQSSADK